jgi:hypothetical protein
MSNNLFEVVEIYPKILVYKNVFNDPQKNYEILKESTDGSEDRIFSQWSKWSIFGEYLNPTGDGISPLINLSDLDNLKVDTETKEKQKLFLEELYNGFYSVSNHYMNKFSNEFDFNLNETVVDQDGNTIPRWKAYGPSIAKYHKDPSLISEGTQSFNMAMTYHSDFIREPIVSPGYKFAITVLAYFNDDYSGGEIDFCIGNKLYAYKPTAGDFLVFPSGHPDILSEEGIVYLHGVKAPSGEHKYLSRMYWQRYSEASQEWIEKEKEFGKETWLSMQEGIMEEYRTNHPQRYEIPNGVRIQ